MLDYYTMLYLKQKLKLNLQESGCPNNTQIIFKVCVKSHVFQFFLRRFEKSVPPQQNAFDKSYFVFVFLFFKNYSNN